MDDRLTHFDNDGKAIMVDVGGKKASERVAIAAGEISMQPMTLDRILDKKIEKGDVFGIARIAGIMAAKQTSSLIPLCHPLGLTNVSLDFSPDRDTGKVVIKATAKVTGQTGVEMEALTAVCVAGLTIYDMCKAIDKRMVIGAVRLLEKRGGKSGHFIRRED